MRVSTAQFYFQNAQQLSSKQSNVNEQTEFLASGKRVLTAKDDAVSFGTLMGYKNELNNIDKYQRNITQAENRNSLQDTVFSSAENSLQKLKQLFIQAGNGTLSQSELDSLADLTRNAQDQLLDLANTKDETGGYIFAGYQVDKKPFELQTDDSVIYTGDSGVRQLQISKSVQVEINQSGDEAFEKVPNPIGDFGANYIVNTSGVSVNRAVISDPSNYDDATNPPDFKLTFSAPNSVSVTDGGGATVYPATPYVAGQIIAFPVGAPSVEVQLSGNPLPGDEIDLTPQQSVSVFEAVKGAIHWMENGLAGDAIQREVDYSETLSQLDNALNHMTMRRTDAGVRLQLIDSKRESHLDNSLVMEKGQANIEDLDFAKAVATFEQSKVALQAAQQTFVQIKSLSLFNYL